METATKVMVDANFTSEEEIVKRAAEQLDDWARVIGGRAWGASKGKPRIYMPISRKDVTVFFEFLDFPTGDDLLGSLLGGAKLCVQIRDCGQHPNWYKGQREKIMRGKYTESLSLSALACGERELAEAIMARGGVSADELNLVSLHLSNGRIDEAKSCFSVPADADAEAEEKVDL